MREKLERSYPIIGFVSSCVHIPLDRAQGRARLHKHSELVTKCQQQGIPLQQAVARNHCQCNQRCAEDEAEFSARAKSTTVQVWNSRDTDGLQVAQDATRS